MADLTAEELFDMMRLTAISRCEEKENHRPEVNHPGYHGNKSYHGNDTPRASNNNNNNNSNNDNNNKLLIVIDARPFHSLGDVLQMSSPLTRSGGQNGGDLGEVSLAGSVRVHYPNLLRKRSKGKMTLENVIVDQNARSLVINQQQSSSSSPILHPSSSSSPPTTLHTSSFSPKNSCIVVYDQNTSTASELPEDCDAKMALKVLLLSCREDVRICFLAGGLERFYDLHPDLCTPPVEHLANEKRFYNENVNKRFERCPYLNTSDDNSDIPCQLLPWLFLGSQSHATNPASLHRLGITALLNVAALNYPPNLPIRSAPVGKPPNNATRFPFTPNPASSSSSPLTSNSVPNFRIPKVPSNHEPITYSGVHKEHKYRRMTRKGFYFKQYIDQSQRGIHNPCYKLTNGLQVLNLPIADNLDTEISIWFDQCNSFIERIRSDGGRVLVHCQAGISRSATICLAYLIWSKTSKSLNEAFDYVRSRRSIVAPNFNFMRQLEEYETNLISGRCQYRCKSDAFLIQTPSSLPNGLTFQNEFGVNKLTEKREFKFTFDRPAVDVRKEETSNNNNNTRDIFIKRRFSFAETATTPFYSPDNKIFSNVVANKPPSCEKRLKPQHPSSSQKNDRKIMARVNKFLNGDVFLNIPKSKKKSFDSKPACCILANKKSIRNVVTDVVVANNKKRQCHKFVSKCCCCCKFDRNIFYPLIQRPRILCHQHFRCRNNFTGDRYHDHRQHHHRRHLHNIKGRRSHNKLIHPEMIFDDDAVGDDDDLYVSLRLILILVMAVAIVFLVEKKHLL